MRKSAESGICQMTSQAGIAQGPRNQFWVDHFKVAAQEMTPNLSHPLHGPTKNHSHKTGARNGTDILPPEKLVLGITYHSRWTARVQNLDLSFLTSFHLDQPS